MIKMTKEEIKDFLDNYRRYYVITEKRLNDGLEEDELVLKMQQIDDMIECLPLYEKIVVTEHYCELKSLRKIARKWQFSRTKLNNIIKHAIDLMYICSQDEI